MAADLDIVEGGGTATPKFVLRLLDARRVFWLAAYIMTFVYIQFIFTSENIETTRMSEHSLMPGLVTTRFDKGGLTLKYGKEILALNKTMTQQEFICNTLESYGIHCFTQKWKSKVASQNRSGENAYAYIRAPRADGAEAMLIAVRMGSKEVDAATIAMILSFAVYANEQVYWARDIVLVFVDGNDTIDAAIGFDAFLSAYHLEPNPALEVDPLHEPGGFLLAGIVYEINPKRLQGCKMYFKLNGLNGNLPNLDLFNGVVNILRKSEPQCDIGLYGVENINSDLGQLIPYRAVYTQAFVAVEGLHSVMSRYAVQGLTIGLHHPINPNTMGKFVEAVSRMLNNALERLHQSYFMYVLSDSHHFASIAYYMPVIALLISPLLINAYHEWTQMEEFEIPTSFFTIHIYGIVVGVFGKIGAWVNDGPLLVHDPAQLPIQVTVETLVLILMGLPSGVILLDIQKPNNALRMIIQLEIALVLGCLSLLNFGLAAIVGLVVVPLVAFLNSDLHHKQKILLRMAVLMASHPIFIIFCGRSFLKGTFLQYGKAKTFISWTLAEKVVGGMLRDHTMLGSNLFPLLTIFGIPIWNLLFRALPFFTEEEKEQRKLTQAANEEKKEN